MNEAEWLGCADPGRMLGFLHGTDLDDHAQPARGCGLSARKRRLFACALCRQVWHLLKHEGSRRAVEVAERYADGQAARREVGVARAGARRAFFQAAEPFAVELVARTLGPVSRLTDSGLPRWFSVSAWHAAGQAALLRDLAGNPFRPVLLAPEEPGDTFAALDVLGREPRRSPAAAYVPRHCLTPTTLSLAQAAYLERLPSGQLDPARLYVLTDALEEAGCEEASLLAHLRSPGPHWRGAWGLDLLLGKE